MSLIYPGGDTSGAWPIVMIVPRWASDMMAIIDAPPPMLVLRRGHLGRYDSFPRPLELRLERFHDSIVDLRRAIRAAAQGDRRLRIRSARRRRTKVLPHSQVMSRGGAAPYLPRSNC
jgi:hypothetical protein